MPVKEGGTILGGQGEPPDSSSGAFETIKPRYVGLITMVEVNIYFYSEVLANDREGGGETTRESIACDIMARRVTSLKGLVEIPEKAIVQPLLPSNIANETQVQE